MRSTVFDKNRVGFYNDDGSGCVVFEIDDNGEVRLTYSDVPQLSDELLELLFQKAPDCLKNAYSTIFLGTINPEDKNRLLYTVEHIDVDLVEDYTADELYVVAGSDFSKDDTETFARLKKHWDRVKLFTCAGFENYLLGKGGDKAEEGFFNKLLRYCIWDDAGYFRWPSTDFYPSYEMLSSEVFLQKLGVLGAMGYEVREDSLLTTAERRSILRRVYMQRIPYVPGPDPNYMTQWGSANTACRLKKIADSLAAFARNFKRRQDAYRYINCIKKWEADLSWLKEEFYIGQYDDYNLTNHFQWPAVTGDYYGYR